MVFNDVNPDDKNVRVKLMDNGKRLEFTHIKEEDRGKYICKASSRVGEAIRSQAITLLSKNISITTPIIPSQCPSSGKILLLYLIILISFLQTTCTLLAT